MSGRLVKNFTLSEMNIYSLGLILPEVVEFAQEMQELRNWYKKPLNVNSWYRTVGQNKTVGGDKNSAHLVARAVDIRIVATDAMINKWKEICQKHGKIGGVNRYKTFTHFTDNEDRFGYKKFVIRDYRKEK